MLNETLGKVNFWIMLLGFNLTFGPMHILGLQGMSRRIYTYDAGYGFEIWNMVATIGAFTLAAQRGVLPVQHLLQPGQGQAPAQPRPRSVGRPHHRVDDPVAGAGVQLRPDPDRHPRRRLLVPQVRRDADHRLVRTHTIEEVAQKGDATGVHLPSPSYWPIVLAFGLPIIAYGLIYSLWLCAVGGAVVVGGDLRLGARAAGRPGRRSR